MQVAAVQFDIAWEDKPANHAAIESILDSAEIAANTYVVLPELCDTGFSFDLDAIVDDQTQPWAADMARRRGIWLQPGFAERRNDGRGRNCAAIISPDGELRAVYRKVDPFSFGRESNHYAGGDEVVIRRCPDAAVCPMICYDLRFPELWRVAAVAGAEVFTIGASWPEARQTHWRALLIARAIENQAYVVAVNRVGTDPLQRYTGGSIVIGPKGDVLAECGDRSTVLTAQLDLGALRRWREEFPALQDIRSGLLGSIRVDSTVDD